MRKVMISHPHPILFCGIKSRRMGWAEHVACMGERRDRVLVRKLEGKRPFGRNRRGWDDNFKTDFQEVMWGHGQD